MLCAFPGYKKITSDNMSKSYKKGQLSERQEFGQHFFAFLFSLKDQASNFDHGGGEKSQQKMRENILL